MRLLWELSDLFICLILSRLNAVTCVIYVENGKSVTINPNVQGQPEEILWTFNGNKLAEYDDATGLQEYGQFRGRSEIEFSTGQLTVHAMTSNDSGIYRSEIEIDTKLQTSENEVQVIDALEEPRVTCQLNNTSQSRALFCSVSSQFPVSYEWTGSSSARQSGRELHIGSEEKSDSVYTCTVKNEVSKNSSNFALKDCGTDEPQSYQNIILAVALSIAAAVIVTAIIVAVVCFSQQGRNRGDYVIPRDNVITMTESSTEREEPNEDVSQALWNSDDAERNREQDENDSGVGCVDNSEANRIESERDGGVNGDDEEEADEEQDVAEASQVRREEPSRRNLEKSAAPGVNQQ